MLRRVLLGGAAAVMALGFAVEGAEAAYPERPITLIVPWGAGGGTDATGRIMGELLSQELGVSITVVNRTGGSGVVGHNAIATAEPDGYTLGVITVEIGMMHWAGLTDLNYEDYTPLGLYNEDIAAVQVRADAPWDTLEELLDAIRENPPGTFKASGTGQGGIWHLALAGMLSAADIETDLLPWVPSESAAAGLQDLVAGGVDIVPCSMPEAQALVEAGRVKSLAIMGSERAENAPDVPALSELGIDWGTGAWRGIGGPAGLPDEVVEVLEPAIAKVFESDAFQDFMQQRGFDTTYLNAAEMGAFMEDRDAAFGQVMTTLGLAQ